jgi:hypothetical protein
MAGRPSCAIQAWSEQPERRAQHALALGDPGDRLDVQRMHREPRRDEGAGDAASGHVIEDEEHQEPVQDVEHEVARWYVRATLRRSRRRASARARSADASWMASVVNAHWTLSRLSPESTRVRRDVARIVEPTN